MFKEKRELNHWVGLIWLREGDLIHGEPQIALAELNQPVGRLGREGDLVQGKSQIALLEPNQP